MTKRTVRSGDTPAMRYLQRSQPAPRTDSTLRQPFQRHVSRISVPGGNVMTTGEFAFGAKRNVMEESTPFPELSETAAGSPVTDTFVFSVEALSAETNVSLTGLAFVLA